MRSQPTDIHSIYTVHSPQQPQYTMYASTSSAWHHITNNFMAVCPYNYFTHTSTTSHIVPQLVPFAPSAPYYPTQHYVTLHLFTSLLFNSLHLVANAGEARMTTTILTELPSYIVVGIAYNSRSNSHVRLNNLYS